MSEFPIKHKHVNHRCQHRTWRTPVSCPNQAFTISVNTHRQSTIIMNPRRRNQWLFYNCSVAHQLLFKLVFVRNSHTVRILLSFFKGICFTTHENLTSIKGNIKDILTWIDWFFHGIRHRFCVLKSLVSPPYLLLYVFIMTLSNDLTYILLDFSLTVKAATLIFISGCGSAISSAKEGKSGFIYNLGEELMRKRACIS